MRRRRSRHRGLNPQVPSLWVYHSGRARLKTRIGLTAGMPGLADQRLSRRLAPRPFGVILRCRRAKEFAN